ncbi:hypothetical protein MOMA_03710 [Moraxella macacae 0408225]|uniref:Uncharacterized protein n=1 Tax=Moraxella macacae 0408225 TaxID=1230338 RepID=L2FAI3_9GAMM|nr:hypothetical protein [Moraxella macacae]ELA09478.1 hypothetical protein MOMA_03710 [Moraxella macacae 0408225]
MTNQAKNPKTSKSALLALAKFGLIATTTATTATVIGVFATYQYFQHQTKQRRNYTVLADHQIHAQRYHGHIQKIGNNATFSNQSATYHLYDPMSVIDDLAKQAGVQTTPDNQVLDFEAEFIAELSQKGHYGTLGHHDYQLTVLKSVKN